MVLHGCSCAARGRAVAHGVFHAGGSRWADRGDDSMVKIHAHYSLRYDSHACAVRPCTSVMQNNEAPATADEFLVMTDKRNSPRII